MDKKKVLIVEDDKDIALLEETYLVSFGYDTKTVCDGNKAEAEILSNNYSCIILDAMLPGKDGFSILKDVREKINLPILMVTSRGDSFDKIRGLGIGADDYILKPFDPAELVARVNSNIRQYERMKTAIDKENEVVVLDVRILLDSWKVYKKDKEIKFPNREFEILKLLATNPNIVLSKEKIFERVWGFEYYSDDATVMVHINRIREKIEDDPKNPKIIETVWGAGYRFNK